MRSLERPELNLREEEPVQRMAATLRMSVLEALHAMDGLPLSALSVLAGVNNPQTQNPSIKPNNPIGPTAVSLKA